MTSKWLAKSTLFKTRLLCSLTTQKQLYKSSAVAEMGDRGHNRHGPKRGGAVPFLRELAGTPSSTMWPGPRSTAVPSGVFNHPAIWPQ